MSLASIVDAVAEGTAGVIAVLIEAMPRTERVAGESR